MRDIRFRAWFNHKPTWCNRMFYSSEEPSTIGDWFSEVLIEQDNAILMQYIGLKDKNNKEIYEGDIIKYFHGGLKKLINAKVIWYKEWCGFAFETRFDSGGGLISHLSEKYKIIGNIYENPELK